MTNFPSLSPGDAQPKRPSNANNPGSESSTSFCGPDLPTNGENALGSSQRRLQIFFENASIGMAVVSMDGHWLEVNEALCRITGYDAQTLRTLTIDDITHPADREADRGVRDELSAGKRAAYRLEKRYIRRDGGILWSNLNVTLVRDDAGNPEYLVGAFEDITAQKEMEFALRNREELLASEAQVFADLSDLQSRLWYMSDLNQGLDEILEAAMRVVGAEMGVMQVYDPPRRVLRLAAQRGFSGPYLESLQAVSPSDELACGLAFSTGEPILIEDIRDGETPEQIRAAGRAGGYRAVQSLRLTGRNGLPLGVLSTLFRAPRHVSERELRWLDLYRRLAAAFVELCRAAEELRQSETRLRLALDESRAATAQAEQQRELLHAVLGAVEDGVTVANAQGSLVMRNPAAAALGGRSGPDVSALGSIYRLTSMEGEPLSAEDWPVARVLRGEPLSGLEVMVESRNTGREWAGSFSGSPIRDSSGDVAFAVMTFRDITERKRAETALEASRAMLQSALASMSDAVFISDPEGRFTEFNDAFVTFHKFKDKSECARTLLEYPALLDVFRPNGELLPLDQWAVPRALRGDIVTNAEYGLRRKDTGEFWVGSYNFSPIRDPLGVIVGCVVVGRDITLQKEAQRALRESERRLKLALEASSAGIWSWDARTRQANWDDRFHAQYGFTPEAPRTFNAWLSRVHPDDRPRFLAGIDQAMQAPGKDEWDEEFRSVRPDGGISWHHGRGRAERDADGRIVEFTGISLDVTARQKARVELEQVRAQHAEDAETMQRLLETAAQGVLSVDAKGTIVTANSALSSMLGWEVEALVGQPIDRLLPLGLRGAHAQHRAEYLAAPKPRPMGSGMELMAARKDGSPVPVEVSLNHVSTASGGRTIAFVTDISARRRNELALHESHVALQASMLESQRRADQLRRLAAQLTLTEQNVREQLARTLHDHLQQLLFAASLALKRAAKAGASATELLESAGQDIDEAIAAARSLAVDLFPPMLHDVGLSAAFNWLAGHVRRKHGLSLELNVDPKANPEGRELRILIFESVRELLFNVVKHSGVDRALLNLEATADDLVRITITDDGEGFDPVRILDSQQDHHTGLGLFSIRERLALLGGRLDIQSAPGHGARFTLTAPRWMHRANSADADRESRFAVPQDIPAFSIQVVHTEDTGRLTILIVDDHAYVREGLRGFLAGHPECVVVGEAADGIEAVEQARRLHPDVMMMDISMPGMDGIEATRRIHAELPNIRIFVLSTQEHLADPHAIEAAGAVGYFTKGEDSQVMIEELLRLHTELKAPQSMGAAASRNPSAYR